MICRQIISLADTHSLATHHMCSAVIMCRTCRENMLLMIMQGQTVRALWLKQVCLYGKISLFSFFPRVRSCLCAENISDPDEIKYLKYTCLHMLMFHQDFFFNLVWYETSLLLIKFCKVWNTANQILFISGQRSEEEMTKKRRCMVFNCGPLESLRIYIKHIIEWVLCVSCFTHKKILFYVSLEKKVTHV